MNLELEKDDEGEIKQRFQRLGSGEERINRIVGEGHYSPIARLIAKWLVKE